MEAYYVSCFEALTNVHIYINKGRSPVRFFLLFILIAKYLFTGSLKKNRSIDIYKRKRNIFQ